MTPLGEPHHMKSSSFTSECAIEVKIDPYGSHATLKEKIILELKMEWRLAKM